MCLFSNIIPFFHTSDFDRPFLADPTNQPYRNMPEGCIL
jgi:hypothetical protein